MWGLSPTPSSGVTQFHTYLFAEEKKKKTVNKEQHTENLPSTLSCSSLTHPGRAEAGAALVWKGFLCRCTHGPCLYLGVYPWGFPPNFLHQCYFFNICIFLLVWGLLTAVLQSTERGALRLPKSAPHAHGSSCPGISGVCFNRAE